MNMFLHRVMGGHPLAALALAGEHNEKLAAALEACPPSHVAFTGSRAYCAEHPGTVELGVGATCHGRSDIDLVVLVGDAALYEGARPETGGVKYTDPSIRSTLPGGVDINVIVVDSKEEFDGWQAATAVMRKMVLDGGVGLRVVQDKGLRVPLFQMVRAASIAYARQVETYTGTTSDLDPDVMMSAVWGAFGAITE